MRSGLMSGIRRPSNVFTMSISFERPASMREVHQVPPAVEMSDTRSPSRVPFSRKLATAAFAWLARHGVMCMSSKTTTNVRARCSSGVMFEEILGGGGAAADGFSGSSTASNVTTSCLTPSSVTVMSAAVRPLIGTPFLSVTTTSTITCSSWVGKVGVSAERGSRWAGDGGLGAAGRGAAGCAEGDGFSCASRLAASGQAQQARSRSVVSSSSSHPTFTNTRPSSTFTS